MSLTGDALELVMMGGLYELFRDGSDIKIRCSRKILPSEILELASPRSCYEIDKNKDYLTQVKELIRVTGLQAREGFSLAYLFSVQGNSGSCRKTFVTFYQVPSQVIEDEVKEFASAFLWGGL